LIHQAFIIVFIEPKRKFLLQDDAGEEKTLLKWFVSVSLAL